LAKVDESFPTFTTCVNLLIL